MAIRTRLEGGLFPVGVDYMQGDGPGAKVLRQRERVTSVFWEQADPSVGSKICFRVIMARLLVAKPAASAGTGGAPPQPTGFWVT